MELQLQLLVSLAIIHTVALASPGPDFALVVKLAAQEHRRTAVAAALGLAVAITGHTLLSLTGVSLIIKSSPTLFMAVQLIGASYLGWMGIGAVRAAVAHWRDEQKISPTSTQGHGLGTTQGFIQGVSTNLLNPKALVFFITLFSTLITPEVTLATKVAATVMIFALSLGWFSLIALVLSHPKMQLKMKRATPLINLMTGLLFIFVAGVILLGALAR
ncbi:MULTISPECIES: LysE family translocator [Shewanella]|uniref:LysE family translocator n=1 Tax=Shewanella marisflavi TaxID=260364 RepID=A0ABX5WN32_9GAMM|nr:MULTISPECIES: LysE family translocator [Shewanella]QDF75802.1 LysE family translocator [Shewanella marisflavi]